MEKRYRNVVDLDYETQSEANLKEVGAFKYSKHPSTQILCFAYKINNEPVKLWKQGTKISSDFFALLNDPTTQIVAHNAMFEYAITKNVLSRINSTKLCYFLSPEVEQYKCTAAKAAAHAFPRDLENAAIVSKLPVQKNMDGRKLIMKYTKPRRQWLEWNIFKEGPEPKKWYDDYMELQAIYEYCMKDVEVEHALDKALPDLSAYEQDTWVRNVKANERGITIDVEACRKIVSFNNAYNKKQNQLAKELTGGAIETVGQVQELTNWLTTQNVFSLDLRAESVKEILENEETSPRVQKVLRARQIVSMTSNKKYIAFLKRADENNRITDNTMYHGASTGREAGRGVQVQNLPRGLYKGMSTDAAIEILKECKDLQDVELYFKDPSKVFSSCIRGMITASPGKELFASDANAIECRVLNWIAKQNDVISAYRNGEDQYKILASSIFGKPVDQITDDERFVGKQGELASGYGVGAVKFANMCLQFGRDIGRDLAERTIKIYRYTHQNVVRLWKLYENAAIRAVTQKTSVTVGSVTWFYKNEHLWCKLPSGRNLCFPYPSIRMERAPWGEMLPKLYYFRPDPLTKKWVNRATYGGSLVESVCQATARDIIVQGIKNVEDDGFNYMFQVHDEVISEFEIGKRTIEEYSKLLAKPAPWYEDLPLKYGGWVGPRYKKG